MESFQVFKETLTRKKKKMEKLDKVDGKVNIKMEIFNYIRLLVVFLKNYKNKIRCKIK